MRAEALPLQRLNGDIVQVQIALAVSKRLVLMLYRAFTESRSRFVEPYAREVARGSASGSFEAQ
jgi:hypothetical protein